MPGMLARAEAVSFRWQRQAAGPHGSCGPGASARARRRLAPPGALEEVLPHASLGLPNGMAWDMGAGGDDGPVMYFVDSGAQTITAYDADAGGVPLAAAPGRLVAAVPAADGVPDGMTIDRCGAACKAPPIPYTALRVAKRWARARAPGAWRPRCGGQR